MAQSEGKARARKLAARQAGRITYAQLCSRGVTRNEIRRWTQRGELIRTRPRVYAVGHVRADLLARLWEAVLFAGPDARLTGASGAHHLGLIDFPPRAVTVATPRKCASLAGIVVLQSRPGQRTLTHDGLPVAPLAELMIDLAAGGNELTVRKALSNLEYRRELDVAALVAVCARGRRGSRLLRRALARRLPQLAHCRSPLEVDFLLLLEAYHLSLPKFNVRVHGILVDAYWPELGLIVELDGEGNHGTAYQKRRDADSMAVLRAHGLRVERFSSGDVRGAADATVRRLGELGVTRVSA